jgi:hypothetical protein
MNERPPVINEPTILVIASKADQLLIDYGSRDEDDDVYKIVIRTTYGNIKDLTKSLIPVILKKQKKLKKIQYDVQQLVNFCKKNPTKTYRLTIAECTEMFKDLCETTTDSILVSEIDDMESVSASVLANVRAAPLGNTIVSKFCGYCGKAASLLCARCQQVAYCDATCQKFAWPTHKAVCVRPKGCAVPVAVRAPSAAASVPSAAARAPSAAASAPSAAASSVEGSKGSSLPEPNAAPSEGGRRKRRRKTLKKNKKGRHSRKA